MPLPNRQISATKKLVLVSMLIALALVLRYVERSFGVILPIPGVKLGLANVVTLTSLFILNFRQAFLFVIARVFLGSFFGGSMVTFAYSLSGGILSFLAMYCLLHMGGGRVSTVGISVVGAVCHNIGQLLVVSVMTSSIYVALSYFPLLAISGIITGVIIGFTVQGLLPYIRRFL